MGDGNGNGRGVVLVDCCRKVAGGILWLTQLPLLLLLSQLGLLRLLLLLPLLFLFLRGGRLNKHGESHCR